MDLLAVKRLLHYADRRGADEDRLVEIVADGRS